MLQRPQLSLYNSYYGFIEEMRELGETIWERMLPTGQESPEEFIRRLLKAASEPEPGLVAETVFVEKW